MDVEGMIAGGGKTPGFFAFVADGIGFAGWDATFAHDIFLDEDDAEGGAEFLANFIAANPC